MRKNVPSFSLPGNKSSKCFLFFSFRALQFGKPDATANSDSIPALTPFVGICWKRRGPRQVCFQVRAPNSRAFENGPLTFISVSEGIKTDTKTPFQRGKARQREALRPTGQNVVNCFFFFPKKEVCDVEEDSAKNRSKTAPFSNQLLRHQGIF